MDTVCSIHPTALVLPGAIVTGDVQIGAHCGIWFQAVVRGDLTPIRIGEETNIQDGAVLHTGYHNPLTIGCRVSVGHRAILHGCTIGDDTLIGMGAIVMNGAVIGKNCIVAAGALIPQGMIIPDGMVAMGIPAKTTRSVTLQEQEHNRNSAVHYIQLLETYR